MKQRQRRLLDVVKQSLLMRQLAADAEKCKLGVAADTEGGWLGLGLSAIKLEVPETYLLLLKTCERKTIPIQCMSTEGFVPEMKLAIMQQSALKALCLK